MKDTDILIRWLKEALDIELSIIVMLEAHEKEAEEYDLLRSKIHDYIRQCEMKILRLKDEIKRLGDHTIIAKPDMAHTFLNLSGEKAQTKEEILLRNIITLYTAFNFEKGFLMATSIIASEISQPKTEEIVREMAIQEGPDNEIQKLMKIMTEYFVNTIY